MLSTSNNFPCNFWDNMLFVIIFWDNMLGWWSFAWPVRIRNQKIWLGASKGLPVLYYQMMGSFGWLGNIDVRIGGTANKKITRMPRNIETHTILCTIPMWHSNFGLARQQFRTPIHSKLVLSPDP